MMKVNGVSVTLSKDIAKMGSSLKTQMGGTKALAKKSSCRGLEDPCIKGAYVGKQLSKLISKK